MNLGMLPSFDSLLPRPTRWWSLAAILCLALGSPPRTRAEIAWTLQSPLPTSADLFGVSMASPIEGWAVGSAGEILHTRDGGATWDRQAAGTDLGFNAVFFLDALHGWAVGTRFARTTDGGATWQLATNIATTYGVDFVDPLHGWAVGNGGVAFRTTDGGVTWPFVSTDGGNLGDVDFVDTTTGWAVGGFGRILKSTDGGLTWEPQVSHTNAWLSGVCFVSATEGFAAGWGQILHTTNGGTAWDLASDIPNVNLADVSFVDSQHGLAVGDTQKALRTTDGGLTWDLEMLGDVQTLESVSMFDLSRGIAVGRGGHIYTTADGGVTWERRRKGTTSGTHTFDAIGAQHVWAANNGEVVKTTDGGANWLVLPRGLLETFPDGLDFIDPQRGWTVHANGRVYRTNDGGASWASAQVTTEQAIDLEDIAAADQQILVTVGGETIFRFSRIYRSSDGGITWVSIPHPNVAFTFYDITFATPTLGFAGGNFGNILRTTDAGLSWTISWNGGGGPIADIDFAGPAHGWAVGPVGLVLHTTNGGVSWEESFPFDENLTAVTALSPTTAWISGTNRRLARTTDGGGTWIADDTSGFPGQGSFSAIAFLDLENGWAAYSTGYPFGRIYRRSDSSTTSIETGSTAAAAAPPLRVEVSPNPMRNGATFSLALAGPTPGPVTLRIYDVEGRLVRRLAAGPPGALGAAFDLRWRGDDAAGRMVPAGHYVYCVDAGGATVGGKISVLK